MTNRIPPSLKWLVDKRSRINGEIIRMENENTVYVDWYSSKMSKLTKDLAAIDRALSLHEIKITPNIIPPTQKRLINDSLKHGELSSLIIQSINDSKDGSLNAKEIATYIGNFKKADFEDIYSFSILVESVKNRIKNLCNQNKLKRLPKKRKGSRVQYSLNI